MIESWGKMKVRRCSVLYLEPREKVEFDFGSLVDGGTGMRRHRYWVALAPHVGEELTVTAVHISLLASLSPRQWVDPDNIQTGSRKELDELCDLGLVIGDAAVDGTMRARDEAIRAQYWHPLSAVFHAFTRWTGADAVKSMRDTGTATAAELRAVLGAPPAEAISVCEERQRFALQRGQPGDFDTLLARRATCRNFDGSRPLSTEIFSQLVERVFAARSLVRVADDTVFLKKSSPSGGGLHPIEAYLLIRNVEGIAAGLYHYHPLAHALEPMPAPSMPLDQLMMEALAQQHWFADAHVLVVMSPRYARNFWKYRHHAKAYRAIVLEAGHLSQTLYLSATEMGLGAYVTCAINESVLEQAFGLDSLAEGVLAVCGFGWRAEEMETAELDPRGEVWRLATVVR